MYFPPLEEVDDDGGGTVAAGGAAGAAGRVRGCCGRAFATPIRRP